MLRFAAPILSPRGTGALLALALASAAPALALPTYDEVRKAHVSTEGVLLDRHGEVIHELRVDMRGRRLEWVTLDGVSPAFLRAVVRAEDKRFYEHAGVDWLALTDAALDSMFSSKPRGASTLSMQVAAMLEASLKPRKQRRTVGQKWDQIQAARDLEKKWTKRQILEAYLNLSTFRGEVQGVGAAARALFGKDASGLDEQEALILAVLLRGPNAQPPVVVKRACGLAQSMQPPLACDGLAELAELRLSDVPNLVPAAALAPHVARELVSAEARRVESTLDAGLQAVALDAAGRQLAALGGQNVADAAVLAVDNRSGEVLAYVGNAEEISSARFVDGVRAPRQAGSALKPFLYELALEQRLLTAASLLDDSPVAIVTPAGLYVPQNYDRDFKGMVSLRTALSGSLNVPAVRTLALLGPDLFVERLRALGFDAVRDDGEHYGYSLALGSAEVTLWQLANAYRTLANGGLASPMRLTPGERARGQRVLDPAAAHIVTDILADRLSRSITFGLDSPLAPRFWAAVKTGTSKDMRDNWCVGFTARYTVAVWVGNFDGSAMWDVSGVSGAAPLWLEMINALHQNVPSHAPPDPPGVERVPITFEAALEPDREELFLPGTQMRRVVHKGQGGGHPAIVYPASGQIIAVDPDIPPDTQRVRFRAVGVNGDARWRLNGEPLADASSWHPAPGRWRLVLEDAAGVALDEVEFEVRGAPADVQGAADARNALGGGNGARVDPAGTAPASPANPSQPNRSSPDRSAPNPSAGGATRP
ncbi:MAG TPA: penicillin-binding protein 1C [Burkholderiales bacterium]|nr:penicillin-binding protein 1C [Burkholderiales bacterium]